MAVPADETGSITVATDPPAAPVDSALSNATLPGDRPAAASEYNEAATDGDTPAQPEENSEASKMRKLEAMIAALQVKVSELEKGPTTLFSKIENRLQTVENLTNPQNDPLADPLESDWTKCVKPAVELNFLTIDEWEKRKLSLKKRHAAIDVVVAGNNKTAATALVESDNPSVEDVETIKFLQVNAIPVNKLYYHILGVKSEQDFKKPLAFLAPWKTFTTFYDEFEKEFAKLQARYKSREDADARAMIKCSRFVEEIHMDEPRDEPRDGRVEEVEKTAGEVEKEGGMEPSVDRAEPKSDLAKTSGGSVDDEASKPELSKDENSENGRKDLDHTLQLPGAESESSEKKQADKTPKDVHSSLPKYDTDDLEYDSYEAYLGLKALRTFYQKYVMPRWELLRSNSITEVSFADLVELFQPGDDVYHPSESQRVWRVMKVTGGRPLFRHFLRPEADQETAKTRGSSKEQASESPAQGETQQSGIESQKWSKLSVDGYYLDFDGKDFAPVSVGARVEYFPGKKSIRSLKFWPLRFAGEQYRELTEPGRLFFEKCQPALYRYEGRTLTENPSGESLSEKAPKRSDDGLSTAHAFRSQDITSPIYVDFSKAFQYNPDWAPDFKLDLYYDANNGEVVNNDTNRNLATNSIVRQVDEENFRLQNFTYCEFGALKKFCKIDEWMREGNEAVRTDERERIKPLDQILLPNRLFGFVFQTRDWACFDVDPKHLKDVLRDESAWNDLQLPPNHKRTLEALVELHFDNKKAMETHGVSGFDFDIINGKGQGLVLLLHGPPGLGKTSTAESLAGKYRKPLLPITCGNLGTDSQSVEANLMDYFHLAQSWDAIVLLDEADVFLAQREKTDLQRNALVSVFLRTLEYYTGILFLTTNRIGAFDEASISRISVSLYYPELGPEEAATIWRNNLRRLLNQKRLEESQIVVEDDGIAIINWARAHYEQSKPMVWNGRQIRNAFQTAVALADFEANERRRNGTDKLAKAVLRTDHFQVVATASTEFEKYLSQTRNMSYARYLDEEGLRAANYSPPSTFDFSSRIGYQTSAQHQQQQSRDPQYAAAASGFTPTKRPTFNSRIPSQSPAPAQTLIPVMTDQGIVYQQAPTQQAQGVPMQMAMPVGYQQQAFGQVSHTHPYPQNALAQQQHQPTQFEHGAQPMYNTVQPVYQQVPAQQAQAGAPQHQPIYQSMPASPMPQANPGYGQQMSASPAQSSSQPMTGPTQ